MICQCPAAASLPDIVVPKCSERIGQIQKIAFQRLLKDDGTKNSFTGEDSIKKLAQWTPFLTAVDSTKIVVSPYIEAPTAEAGAPRTYGGGNDTLGGMETVVGRESTPFSAVLRNMPQSLIKVLKELQCESQGHNLGVYLFDEFGAIGALNDGTNYYPIPAESFFVGDKTLGGLENPDSNAIQWSFLPNWSDDLAVINPEFNPLTDLVIAQ